MTQTEIVDHAVEDLLEVFHAAFGSQLYAPLQEGPVQERLKAAEQQLYDACFNSLDDLAPLQEVPHEVKIAFAAACRLAPLYRQTVGTSITSTTPLETLPYFLAELCDQASPAHAYKELVDRLGLSHGEQEAIQRQVARAETRIAERKALVEAMLRYCEERSDTKGLSFEAVDRLFRSFFPTSPLLPGEVQLVATETSVIFLVPTSAAPVDSDSQSDNAQRLKAQQFLKTLRRVRFSNFAHFPGFADFDFLTFDKEVLTRLQLSLPHLHSVEFSELLHATVSVIDFSSKEKYLVHDTWGHVWQDCLTNFKSLYDKMATLQVPLAPQHTLEIGDNFVSLLELVSVQANQVFLDRELTNLFADQLALDALERVLPPIVAEVCADVVEYCFRFSAPVDLKLPNSSMFPYRCAKLDLTWSDLRFFLGAAEKAHHSYEIDSEIRSAFLDNFAALLKYRAEPGQSQLSTAQLQESASALLRLLLQRYNERVATELAGLKPASKAGHQGVVFQWVRIVSQLNAVIARGEHLGLLPKYWVHFVIFLAKLCDEKPRAGLRRIDESLKKHLLPLLYCWQSCCETNSKKEE